MDYEQRIKVLRAEISVLDSMGCNETHSSNCHACAWCVGKDTRIAQIREEYQTILAWLAPEEPADIMRA